MSVQKNTTLLARQTVDATPDNHPDLVARLNNLSFALGDRYSSTGTTVDQEEAIQTRRSCTTTGA